MQKAYCQNTHSKVSINFILTSWGPLSPTAITSSLESNNKSGIRHIILKMTSAHWSRSNCKFNSEWKQAFWWQETSWRPSNDSNWFSILKSGKHLHMKVIAMRLSVKGIPAYIAMPEIQHLMGMHVQTS